MARCHSSLSPASQISKSPLSSNSVFCVSPESLYRRRKARISLFTPRPKACVSPISRGTVRPGREFESSGMAPHISTMQQSPRPRTRADLGLSVSVFEDRKDLSQFRRGTPCLDPPAASKFPVVQSRPAPSSLLIIKQMLPTVTLPHTVVLTWKRQVNTAQRTMRKPGRPMTCEPGVKDRDKKDAAEERFLTAWD